MWDVSDMRDDVIEHVKVIGKYWYINKQVVIDMGETRNKEPFHILEGCWSKVSILQKDRQGLKGELKMERRRDKDKGKEKDGKKER